MESTTFDSDGVEELGTQTHYSDGGAREVVLIGVKKAVLGADKPFQPPNPYDASLSTEMRRGYFHHRDDVAAQFPRRSDELPVSDEKYQLEHVFWDTDGIHAYYPLSSQEALTITWDYRRDEWSNEVTQFHNYIAEVEKEHPQLVWENRRQI